jgi:hypothetical protein
MPTRELLLTLRITIAEPPAGVAWAMQLGRDQLLPPVASSRTGLRFEAPIRIAPRQGAEGPRFLGAPVQGPPAARFVYLNSGRRAGQVDSEWDRRAKVPLTGITWTLIAEAEARGCALATTIAGTSRDGGPACATVPLVGPGWQLADAAVAP